MALACSGSTGGSDKGAIHLGKHSNSNGVRFEHDVAVTDYSWNAGDWLLIRLTWDFTVAPGVQNIHLYINGTELRLGGQVARAPQAVPPSSRTR